MWDENDHPRDENGRFASKGIAMSARTRYNITRLLRRMDAQRKGFVDIQLFAEKHSGKNVRRLPRIVLARFYDRLGDIRHGEYYETTPTGERVVVIDDDHGRLYRITYTGTFGEPQIVKARVYSYDKAGRTAKIKAKRKKKYDKGRED